MADHREAGPASPGPVHSARSAHSAHCARSVHSAHSAHSAPLDADPGHPAYSTGHTAHTTHSARSARSAHSDAHSAHSAHCAHSAHSARLAVLFLAKLGLLLGALTLVQAIHSAVQNATALAWGLPPLRRSAGLLVLLLETAAGRIHICGAAAAARPRYRARAFELSQDTSSHALLVQAACHVAGPLAVWLLAGFVMMVQLRTVGLPRAVFSASGRAGLEAPGERGWWGRKAQRVSSERSGPEARAKYWGWWGKERVSTETHITGARAENEDGLSSKEQSGLVGRGAKGFESFSPVLSSSVLADWQANDELPGVVYSPEQGDFAPEDTRIPPKRFSPFFGRPAENCPGNGCIRSTRTVATPVEFETGGFAQTQSLDPSPESSPESSPDQFPSSPRAPFRTRSLFRAARASARLLLHVISRLRPGDLLLPYRPLHCLTLLYRSGLASSSTAHLAWLAITGSVTAAALGLLPLYPGTDGARLLCLALDSAAARRAGFGVSCAAVERGQLAAWATVVAVFAVWDVAAFWGNVAAFWGDAAAFWRLAALRNAAALWANWFQLGKFTQKASPDTSREILGVKDRFPAEPDTMDLPDVSVTSTVSDGTSGLNNLISHGFWRRRACTCEYARMVLRSACHEGRVGTCQYGGDGSSRYYLRKAQQL